MANWPLFITRNHREEWMDQPSVTINDFERALADIQWVNRNLSGTKIVLEEIERMIQLYPHQTSYSVMDLGTGSADIPRSLCDWGREHNIYFSVLAVDSHPVAVETSRRLSAQYPEIVVCQKDALELDFPDESFDFVTCSMMLHHLSDVDAVHLLHEMARVSRLGFVINDLERHPFAWLGITAIGWLFGKGRLFRHDAPLSVMNGFKVKELQKLIARADLTGAQIYRRSPYRLAVVYLKNRLVGNYPHG